MKIIFSFFACLLMSWGAAAQTNGKLSNPKAPSKSPVVQASELEICVNRDQANALKKAYEWGTTLANEGRGMRYARIALAQWSLAARCYRQATQIDPTYSPAFSDWAVVLSLQASVSARSDLNAARELFRQASQKFAIALQLDPQSANAANDWGVALGEEAIAISAAAPGNLADARILWDQARQKYALGLQIDPTNGRIARNWASELSIEASSLAPSNLPAARELWKQAYERLANVIGTDPDDALAFVNLTSAMLQERAALLKASSQTLSLANTETVDLLQKAKQMLLALQGNAAGSGAYNLACVYALEGQTANAMQWLERSSAAGRLPKKSHLLKDSDLENLRNTPAFIAWFAKLP